MLAVADDLIKFTKRMESAGVPTHQAQEQSAAIVDLVSSLHNANKPVTQDDLFKIKVELEAKILEAKGDIIKWTIGQNIAIVLAMFGLLHSVAK